MAKSIPNKSSMILKILFITSFKFLLKSDVFRLIGFTSLLYSVYTIGGLGDHLQP